MTMKRVYLNVPYEEHNEAKSNGAMWDAQRKQWFYIKHHTDDDSRFAVWKPHIQAAIEKELRKA